MNIHLKSETKEAIKAFSISGIIIVLFYLIISNLDIDDLQNYLNVFINKIEEYKKIYKKISILHKCVL